MLVEAQEDRFSFDPVDRQAHQVGEPVPRVAELGDAPADGRAQWRGAWLGPGILARLPDREPVVPVRSLGGSGTEADVMGWHRPSIPARDLAVASSLLGATDHEQGRSRSRRMSTAAAPSVRLSRAR